MCDVKCDQFINGEMHNFTILVGYYKSWYVIIYITSKTKQTKNTKIKIYKVIIKLNKKIKKIHILANVGHRIQEFLDISALVVNIEHKPK